MFVGFVTCVAVCCWLFVVLLDLFDVFWYKTIKRVQ